MVEQTELNFLRGVVVVGMGVTINECLKIIDMRFAFKTQMDEAEQFQTKYRNLFGAIKETVGPSKVFSRIVPIRQFSSQDPVEVRLREFAIQNILLQRVVESE